MRVFCNTAMSADGKIATASRTRVAFGSPEDRRRMRALRAEADAVLVGGETFRRWGIPLVEGPEDRSAANLGPRTRPLVNAVLTRRGIVPVDADARVRASCRWPDERVRLLVLGPADLDAEAHRAALGAALRTTAEPDPLWALDVLEAEGCETVLVEGGGELLFPLVSAGRIDRLHLTICPLLVGGSRAPTPLGGVGFLAEEVRRLTLCDVQWVGDELFLRYETRAF